MSTTPELRKRKKPQETQVCSCCKRANALSLLKDVEGVKICIFCMNEREMQMEREKQAEVQRADALVKEPEAASVAALAREKYANRERRARARDVKAQRAAKKASREEVSPGDANQVMREELARRELSRRHLLPFVQRMNDRYEAGWVHKDICQRLEQFSLDVAEGKSPRLMLFMPPRHGKSELASRSFPAWHLGHYPEHEFIACSYASDLATDFSRKVRNLIRSPEYKVLFPKTTLAEDSQRNDRWETTENGGYIAAGVGGPITGRGAHIMVIDDPVKNREEADSEASRRTIKNWYTSTAYSRLAPGGGILIILTRWHDDDLAGWLLDLMQKDQGDVWEVIQYPAEALVDERYRRAGEALHEARYPISRLQQIKKAIGDRDWWALYQQSPVAEDGDIFTREMFPRYGVTELPAFDEMNYYTAWDLAIGQREENDESFGVTVGIDRNRRMWVVDIRYGRWDSEEIVDQILDTYSTWRSEVTGIERGHIEMAIGPYLEQEIARRKLSAIYILPLKPGRRDKVARARPIEALMKRNEVMFRASCNNTEYLIRQMMRFPNGAHDDGVDAMAWVGQMIKEMNPLQEIKAKPKKSWRDRLNKVASRHVARGGAMSA
jgi:predicted phage terminase large subunit-like protein